MSVADKSNENKLYNIWDPNQYVIGLLTTSCNDKHSIHKVLNFAKKINAINNFNLKALVADYYWKKDRWCKVYVGSFGSYNKAQIMFKNLPKFILKNSPFIIEVRKIENLLLKRDANVSFINL